MITDIRPDLTTEEQLKLLITKKELYIEYIGEKNYYSLLNNLFKASGKYKTKGI